MAYFMKNSYNFPTIKEHCFIFLQVSLITRLKECPNVSLPSQCVALSQVYEENPVSLR